MNTTSNTKQKLTNEQRAILLEWLAADYDYNLISQWAEELGWPKVSRQAIHYYRVSRGDSVKRLREERYSKAIDSGLAQKAERVARLKRHADSLEAIKWLPDKNGRLWNEKAWRETLHQIAEEMGDLKPDVNVQINIVSGLIRKAEENGINIADDPILTALFAALNPDRGNRAPDRPGDSSEASRAIIDNAASTTQDTTRRAA